MVEVSGGGRARIAVIGGGPAGLMAAETIARAGVAVTVFEAMPTLGRKLLMAGKSGLNLTHAEPHERFRGRYGAANDVLGPLVDAFDAEAVRAWATGLGIETFVGTSNRVFPTAMKASPLLRAWIARLEALGVEIRTRHRWTGFAGDALTFETPGGEVAATPAATVLALGGASWPRLGSDGRWAGILDPAGIALAPFQPANCGFDVAWSDVFLDRFAGEPVKDVAIDGRLGEFVVSRHGVEGSLVYTASAPLRDRLAATGRADMVLDLVPKRRADELTGRLDTVKGQSLANRLRKAAGLTGVKAGLVREVLPGAGTLTPAALAALIKALPVRLERPRPIDEAISTAGGIVLAGLGTDLSVRGLPGVFAAGEMLDWEAPTGGYLLTACLASGIRAGQGAVAYVNGAAEAAPS